MAGDAVWLDVLPSLQTFVADLVKGTSSAATEAGKKAGAAFSKDFGASASSGSQQAVVAELQKAAAAAEKAVNAETQAIAKARAAQRDAAAKVIEMEGKLTAARNSGDSTAVAAAELRLAAARDRLDGASSKVEQTEKSLEAASRSRKETTKQLEAAEKDLGDATEKSSAEAGEADTAMGRLKQSLLGTKEGGEGAAVGLGKLALAAGAAVGAAALLKGGFDQALETAKGAGKLQASLGLSKEEAQAAGRVAGQLYAQGYGESASDMSAAVGSVISSIQGMRGASEEELTRVAGLAKGFADTFNVDVSEATRNVGVLMKTGLAPDATTAFDLMTASLQRVPEALRGEVMDATQEYSQYFAQLGFDGSQALGMLATASEGGQYQIDKTGDALKEFTIRSTDMSSTSGKAFQALGLDQAEMARQILAGGDQAKGAFDTIVTGLLSMEDPAAQSQAALALFGTPLEDLGTDQIPTFLESLTSTTGGLGDVAGKAQEASDAISANVDPIDSLQRSLSTTVAEGLQPFVQPAQDIAAWAKENPDLMKAVVVGVGLLAGALGVAAIAQWVMNAAMLASPITWVVLGIGLLIAAIVLLVMNLDNVVKFLSDTFGPALQAVQSWFGDLGAKATETWESMKSGASGMVSAVGGFFESLKDKVMTPVKWIADNVINPLLAGIEKVAGFFGVTLTLPRLAFASGGVVGGGAIGTTVAMADGGVLPGYTPGRDVHRFASPTGGLLDLSGGEAIMRPEFTATVGAGWVDGANAAARTGGVSGVAAFLGLATGGIWGKPKEFAGGGIIPNATQGFAGYDPRALAAMQAWAAATGVMWSMTGQGGARTYAQQLALYQAYLAGTGNLAANPDAGLGPHMVPAIAMDLSPRPGENPAAASLLGSYGLGLTVAGEPWHIAYLPGRSGGVTEGGTFDIAQMIKDAIGSVLKVEGAGAFGDILNAIPGKLVDWAVDSIKGTLGFDSGGWLDPGTTVAVNATGQPEAVLTGEQWQAVLAVANQATTQSGGTDPERLAGLIAAAIVRELRAAGLAVEITGVNEISEWFAGKLLVLHGQTV